MGEALAVAIDHNSSIIKKNLNILFYNGLVNPYRILVMKSVGKPLPGRPAKSGRISL
jgi:hypothetical protein